MNNLDIDNILRALHQGQRCSWMLDEDEFSSIISIEHNDDDLYTCTRSTSHKYDVVSPTHYDHGTLNEKELRTFLGQVPDEVFDTVSFTYKDIINEKTHEKVNLIYSYLRQRPRIVYVVFKEDRHETSRGVLKMHFNSLYKDLEQAQGMVDYLKKKQGATCYWREVTLRVQDDEMVLQGELSEFDQVDSKQILATFLDMDKNKLSSFFEG